MSRKCMITGKGPLRGYHVSHAHNKTKRKQLPNLKKRRFFLPEQNKWVELKISVKGIKILDKVGLSAFLRKNNLTIKHMT